MEVAMGIFLAVVVVSIVISQILSSAKKAKQSENSAIITKPKTAKPASDGVFDEFEVVEQKAIRLDPNGLPPKNGAIPKVRVLKSEAQPPAQTPAPTKREAQPYVPIKAQIQSHIHGTLEEKNIPVENSMGETAVKQGCGEHYYSRFLEENDAYEIVKEKKTVLDGAAKAIIIGEILNDPAFKRKGGARKARR